MKIAVIGGDLRLIKLAIMLSNEKNMVYVFAMEESSEINNNANIKKCRSLDEAIYNTQVIICSIPFLKSDGEMYNVFSDEHIKLKDFIKAKHKDKIFIAGSIKSEEKKLLEQYYENVIDIMQEEELTILNTIATAEGAIDVAIRNTDIVLHGSNVLILGFGKVGKIVADKFSKLNTKVTCAARKDTDLAWIQTMGYEAVNINELKEELIKFDIIINTVPQMIIDRNEMQYMNKEVLLIDLASVPGGINTDDVNKMNLKFVWALGLPGKIAPVTSAKFIKETIYNVLNQMGVE